MATENSIYYTDSVMAQFAESSTATINGFVWCEIAGVIVAGSTTVPTVDAFTPTGNLSADLVTWLTAVITTMTGDAPEAPTYPNALFVTGWAVSSGLVNINLRPAVIFQYTDDYDFGTLNLPPFTTEGEERNWFFRLDGDNLSGNEMVPSAPIIEAYATANDGALPVLQVLELNCK